jgi:UDP-N-acetylmuramate--alanine ligase
MVIPLDHPGELAAIVDKNMLSGDLVVCLGAGNITVWANELPSNLRKLRSNLGKVV